MFERLFIQEGGDMCIVTADSCYCTAETNQHCKAVILQLKKKKAEAQSLTMIVRKPFQFIKII